MRSPNIITNALIGYTAAATLLLNSSPIAAADTRIRGEFEYNLESQSLSEWQIGPVFDLDDATELEIPIGQNDQEWQVQPELTYEIEVNDFTVELGLGFEVSVDRPIHGFGSIEGSLDF
ncbi:MAG: hypothetical protein AAF171_22900 [Cyanobacteria bacterium P01_A01_bin.116]